MKPVTTANWKEQFLAAYQCLERKTWIGGYTGIRYTLVCDLHRGHANMDHHWVHEE